MPISAKPGPVKCSHCKKPIRRIENSRSITVVCFRCGLHGLALIQAFESIAKVPDMLEFAATIREWYPTYEATETDL